MVEENLSSEESPKEKKSITLTGYEPATFGFSGKHSNHYTTEATLPCVAIQNNIEPIMQRRLGPRWRRIHTQMRANIVQQTAQ
jgi:hypothetical protein